MVLIRKSVFLAVVAAMMAHMAVGQTYTNVTIGSGISVPAASWPYRGACWADFNNDGWIDLFAPEGNNGPMKLWVNTAGFFIPTAITGGTSFSRRDNHCISADIDNDGDEDIFLAHGNAVGGVQRCELFINDGSGNFTEEAALRGADVAGNCFSASFGDYDRDGFLDLYVGVYGPLNVWTSNVLLRNNGNGTFTDVTTSSGAASPGDTFVGTFMDHNNDMWPDLWIVNDNGSLGNGAPTAVLRNQRNGAFGNVAPTLNAAVSIDGMCCAVADVGNDGGWDVFMSNVTSVPFNHRLLMQNPATMVYTDQAASMGVTSPVNRVAWASFFMDYNNDTAIDLFVGVEQWTQSQLFRGSAMAAPFVDVSSATGVTANLPPIRGACYVDYDNDGNLDIYASGASINASLFRNSGVGAGNYIQLKLQGTNSNRSAIGAQVSCRVGTTVMRRQVLSGDGFLCQSDRRVHFGLGNATAASVEIRWPSGTVQYLDNVLINQSQVVVEPVYAFQGPVTSGSQNIVMAPFDYDLGLPVAIAMCLDVAGEFYLPDDRAIRINSADPILAQTSTPGNPFLTQFSPIVPFGGVALQLTIPPVPGIAGFGAYFIGVTIQPSSPGGIRSILGPQRFVIQ